ncbi:unnamed protein product [Withania somnifera]
MEASHSLCFFSDSVLFNPCISALHVARVKGQDVAFEPAKLLWLILRDFLQGKSVQEMVDEALQCVPNTDGDKNIDQVNQIRDSLARMGDNSTAFSLLQKLKEVVASINRPKIVQGKSLNGKEFVSFLEQILDALNKGEIPSTGSLVEVFNKGILEWCLKLYNERMDKWYIRISCWRMNINPQSSSKLCEAVYTKFEDKMDHLQVLRLPTMEKFNAGFIQCNQSFHSECVGPSKINYEKRMMKV